MDLVTKVNSLDQKMDAIMESLKHSQVTNSDMSTYASALKRPIGTGPALAMSPKPDMGEREIYISLKNCSQDTYLLKDHPTDALTKVNIIINAKLMEMGVGNMEINSQPIKSLRRINTGNIILTARTTEIANHLRTHAEEWAKEIEVNATAPQRSFAVVAHSAPASIWMEQSDMADAIKSIEDDNSDLGLDFAIANICWLNGSAARSATKSGPLMISFKNKTSANKAIDDGLAIKGASCTVTLYVPRPPQCFRCQGWGHRAADCPGDEKCGKCAEDHATTGHPCKHNPPCVDKHNCKDEQYVCANCKGNHASWIRICPVAKAAFQLQSERREFSTGRYENITPATFADAVYKILEKGANQNTRLRQNMPRIMGQIRTLPMQRE
jgi:hypothetical protein